MLEALIKLFDFFRWYLYQKWLHLRVQRMGVSLARTTMIKGKCQITGGKISIGSETIIQSSTLDGRGGLKIGRNVIIDQATILTAQHDIDSPLYPTVYRPVEIGDYAILYYRSIILPGCKIGRGAVVGAAAVVAHDVPDMAVVVGNPARVVRYRKNVQSECDLLIMGGYSFQKQSRKYFARLFGGKE
jgi:acetyltransferase-like isoleucine patch superfamily enzyme